MLTRRDFAKRGLTYAGLAGTAGLITFETGCSVWTDIENYVPAGLAAFSSVIALLEDNGLINPVEGSAIATAITLVKAAFSDIELAVSNYQNAPAADKATLLDKIVTALTAAEAAIQSFWTTANLPGGAIVTLVQGILAIVLSVLGGFLGQIPTTAGKMFAKVPPNGITFTPQKVNKVSEFKKLVNAKLNAAGQSKYAIY